MVTFIACYHANLIRRVGISRSRCCQRTTRLIHVGKPLAAVARIAVPQQRFYSLTHRCAGLNLTATVACYHAKIRPARLLHPPYWNPPANPAFATLADTWGPLAHHCSETTPRVPTTFVSTPKPTPALATTA